MPISNSNRPVILIVDDIPRNLQLLGKMLDQKDYNVSMASNGKDALRILEEITPELILLDIMMPEMDGFEVCQIIKSDEKKRDIPIIFLSARANTEDIVKGFRIGASDYITKPFNTEELMSRVHTHIKLVRATREVKELNAELEHKVRQRTAELQQANERLKQLDSAKSYFLGLLSHELNTPISGIKGYIELLKMSLTDEEHLEYCDMIVESSNRLKKFSDLSMLITSLRLEKYELQIMPVEPVSIIEAAMFSLKDGINAKAIETVQNINNEEVQIKIDPNLIEKVMTILLDNAIKFSPENGKIIINTGSNETCFNIEMIDEGPGFTQEALENIFEFFSSDNLMHHSEGFGLGLAAAKIIMDIHKGKISAKNNDGKGAALRLDFPIK